MAGTVSVWPSVEFNPFQPLSAHFVRIQTTRSPIIILQVEKQSEPSSPSDTHHNQLLEWQLPPSACLTLSLVCSVEQLEDLAQQFLEASSKKRKASDDELVQDLMNGMFAEFGRIDYGYDGWKREKTGDAVDKLQQIRCKPVLDALVSLTEVDAQWRLSLEYTKKMVRVIFQADESAGKRVNGSMGEFCPQKKSKICGEAW